MKKAKEIHYKLEGAEEVVSLGYGNDLKLYVDAERLAGPIALLKACAKQKDLCKGSRVHADIAKRGLLAKDAYVGSTLVDMYAKCGALAKAQQVFNELPIRDVVSWTALIAGYTQNGRAEEALNCFEQMLCEGLSPNAITYVSILKACGSIGASNKGQEIHAEIAKDNLLEKNVVVGTALVDMYAKCGKLIKALEMLDGLSVRNAVSWTALISGYVQHGFGEEALNCFERMQHEGLFPDALTFSCLLKACGSIQVIDKGQEIHSKVISEGLLEKNAVVGNAILDMYARCGLLAEAQDVFDELLVRDVVSWNALITGYAKQGHNEEALNCFEQMEHEGLRGDTLTFTCILKACGSMAAVDKGQELHAEIVREGLMQKDTLIGSALVEMYSKCGAFARAQGVFQALSVRDAVSWGALIVGYAQHGHSQEALNCFRQMRSEGLSPDTTIFTCILKICGSTGAMDMGQEIHADIVRAGLMGKSNLIGNALVDMYAKCGAFAKAHEVLDELPVRNVVSWNVLIAGYVHYRYDMEALRCFARMQGEGLSPDPVTFTCILKACGGIGAIDKGKQIHVDIDKEGLREKDISIGTALVDMYAKCGALAKAQEVFGELPARTVDAWNALIVGYAEYGPGEQALNCFSRMQCEGLSPNTVTFVHILKVCGIMRATVKGQEVHAEIIQEGWLETNQLIFNALVDMYVKCAALAKSQELIDKFPVRDVVSWTTLIAGYAQHGHGEMALNCFQRMQREGFSPNRVTFACILKACGSIGAADKGQEIHAEIMRLGLKYDDTLVANALVDMYAKCGALVKAQEVFHELLVRTVVSWTALIAGYAQHGLSEEALNCFERMQHEGMSPDVITFACVLKACGSIRALDKGQEIHAKLVKEGLLSKNIVVGNALVDMYAKCGALMTAQQVFDELLVRNIVTWNVLIAGYAHHGHGEDALNCFEWMKFEGISPNTVTFTFLFKACGSIGAIEKGQEVHAEIVKDGLLGKDILVDTALVDMYSKCGALKKAREVFEELPVQSVVLWNTLIAGYAQYGHGKEALKCFEVMQQKGFPPNAVTFTCILKACGSIGTAGEGHDVHGKIVREGLLGNNILVGTALVDMYTKCGALVKAQEVFDELPFHDLASWNVLMGGYAQVGKAENVFSSFNKMLGEGIEPDSATFTIVLNACSDSGLLDEGHLYFETMSRSYGIIPTLEHYTCMIDLLGRAGHLNKAVALAKKMPFSSNLAVWHALLGACHKWGNMELGRFAFEHVMQLDENDDAAYCLLSNIYAAAVMQGDVDNVGTQAKRTKHYVKSKKCKRISCNKYVLVRQVG